MALVRHPWQVIALLLITVISYAPLRSAEYVHEDVPSPPSRGLMAEVSAASLASPRALTALIARLQGASTRTAHLVSLSVHLVNGLLLALLIPSVAVVGLFLLHPINSEAVSYVSARGDLLWGTMILLTFLAAKVKGDIGVLFVLMGLWACWSAKETGIMALPLLCLWKPPSKRVAVLSGALALMVAVPFVLSLSRWTAPAAGVWRFLALQSAALWRLAALAIVPVGFTPVHDWYAVPQALGMLAFCGTIALLVWSWQMRRTWPRVSFAVLFAGLALAPRFLVRVPSLITEPHLYVPLMGLWLASALPKGSLWL